MQEINVVIVPTEFIDKHFNELTLPEVKVFIVLCRLTIGYAGQVKKYITMDEIQERASLSRDAVRPAIKLLEERRLIEVEHRRGRGKANGYTIRFSGKMVGINPPFKKGGLKPTLFGFDDPILIGRPIKEQPTGAATPPPDKPAKVKAKNVKSDEEKQAHAELWTIFETALGCKMSGKDAALEAKSIWELIDRVKINGNGWREYLKEVVSRFISYQKNPPAGFDYLKKCLPLPHILNSSRTWMRMVVNPIDLTGPTIEETEEWYNKIVEKGVIQK